MKSLWSDEVAATYVGDDLAMRVYTSRLLGSNEDLVMHGGGNTSVKATTRDFFGNELQVLYVKGSGWDLKSIEKPGFPAIRLKETRMLAELESLSDPDMTRQLRALMLDPSAPSPSVEAILHAILPAKFIDHTHADAVVTLSNNPRGAEILAQIFPDCLILPLYHAWLYSLPAGERGYQG
jgi:rhamnose utilization protein RhaD (predicted bifunctional aldolase and dehydrogenase)